MMVVEWARWSRLLFVEPAKTWREEDPENLRVEYPGWRDFRVTESDDDLLENATRFFSYPLRERE